MSLPEVGPDPLKPSLWAQRVSRSDPHGLDSLEAHVLAYATEADELSKTPKWRIAWNLAPLLALLAAIGGFAAVFGNPRDIAIGRTDAPDAGDIPFAVISYGVAVVGVILILIRWYLDGRRRNGALQIVLALTFAFGVAGVLIAYQLAAAEGIGLGVMMLPAFALIVVALVAFVIIQLSPRQPQQQAKAQVAIDELDEKGMRYVMQERNEAIDALARRHMLPDIDVAVLKARPLGRLHIEEDA